MFFGMDLVKDRITREPHTAAAHHILAVLKKVIMLANWFFLPDDRGYK